MYFLKFMGQVHQVCRDFFSNTLNFYLPTMSYIKKTMPFLDKSDKVLEHINMLHLDTSHYCRADPSTVYFRGDIKSVQQMYELYRNTTEKPLSCNSYKTILRDEIDYKILDPMNLVCTQCSKVWWQTTTEAKAVHREHLAKNSQAKAEVTRDLKRTTDTPNAVVLYFDMGLVFHFPQSNNYLLLHKHKWRTFSLTARSNKSAKIYLALWHEGVAGQRAEHVASALIKILTAFLSDNPQIEHLVLWSDSCVGENRNSVMSVALTNFINVPESHNLRSISQKFFARGHSLVQPLVETHLSIIRSSDVPIASHLGLVHVLKESVGDLEVLDMQLSDFKQLDKFSQAFNYSSMSLLEFCDHFDRK
jgi:hypothetical protein